MFPEGMVERLWSTGNRNEMPDAVYAMAWIDLEEARKESAKAVGEVTRKFSRCLLTVGTECPRMIGT